MGCGILFCIGAFASVLLAQSPGTFTTTGSMITPRFGHTATLLPGGISIDSRRLDRANVQPHSRSGAL